MTFAVDIPDLPAELRKRVLSVPAGRVTTYARLAEALGSASAARWVGGQVLEPDFAAAVPVHRVVRADGNLGLYYTGDAEEKHRKLADEGIEVHNGRVNLQGCLFEDFPEDRPLLELRDLQTEFAKRLQLTRLRQRPKLVGGVDVSYISEDQAVAGYALIEVATQKLLWSSTIVADVTFPYIPSFLAFRELPLLLQVLEQVRETDHWPDMVFVDGNGVLHNRRMGIASMLGILLETPTVGVGKKLLCGRVDLADMRHRETRPVVEGEEILGMALKSRATSKPIFISPGHLCDFKTAIDTAQRLLAGHRLPEPTFQADRVSRAEARRIMRGMS